MSGSRKIKILLVEDDTNLSFVVRDNLEFQDFEVVTCDNGEDALDLFRRSRFDICLLDIMLPKQDGFALAGRIRVVDKNIPILFLTAKSMREDRIHAFNLGADDYITKPFNMEELILRIRVFLKRSGNPAHPETGLHRLHSYTFDYGNLDLIHERQSRKLTQRQADLLKLLCDNAEQIVKREDLLAAIWGNDDYFAGRSMDVFISKLRKYLSLDDQIRIVNYHGIGFKLTLTGPLR